MRLSGSCHNPFRVKRLIRAFDELITLARLQREFGCAIRFLIETSPSLMPKQGMVAFTNVGYSVIHRFTFLWPFHLACAALSPRADFCFLVKFFATANPPIRPISFIRTRMAASTNACVLCNKSFMGAQCMLACHACQGEFNTKYRHIRRLYTTYRH